MRYRMAAALLSLLGLLVASYLYLYKIGRIGTLACGTGGCETVQLSPYSRFLGLEVALYGVGGYLTLLILSLLALQDPVGKRSQAARLIPVLSGIGVLFSTYLSYLELFVIRAVCRWCVGSAVLITATFVVSLLDRRRAPAGRPLPRGDAPRA